MSRATKSQKEPQSTRKPVHLWLKPALVARIDRQARMESNIQPIPRTTMIRVLIERGLSQKEASL